MDYIFSQEGFRYHDSADENPTSLSSEIQSFKKAKAQLSKDLNKPLWDYKIVYESLTRKQLHGWIKNGLITKPEGSRYRFSIVELLWITIIYKLREYGLSINQIKTVKQSLSLIDIDGEYPVLDYGIFCSFYCNDPTFLMIFEDSTAELVHADDLAFNLSMPHIHFYQSMFLLSFNGLMMGVHNRPEIILKGQESINKSDYETFKFIMDKAYTDYDIKIKKTRAGKSKKLITGVANDKVIEGDHISYGVLNEAIRNESHATVVVERHDNKTTKLTIKEKNMLN